MRVGVRGADHGAVQAVERDGAAAAGQADAVADLGDGADGRVLVLVPRHEHDAVLVADVDRQGDVHAGEHDGVLERDEQQIGQSRLTLQAVVGIEIVLTTSQWWSSSIPAASRAASRCGYSSTRTTRPSRMTDDGRPAAEKVRAAALQRPLVGRIELRSREKRMLTTTRSGEPDRAVDDDVVVLGDALGDDLEDAIAVDDDGFLAGGNPLHIRVEHPLERRQDRRRRTRGSRGGEARRSRGSRVPSLGG